MTTIRDSDFGEVRGEQESPDVIEADDLQQRAGETVETYGAVHAIRRLSQVTFVIIRTFRDRLQTVFAGQNLQILDGVKEGDYVRVTGRVVENPEAYKGFELAAEHLQKMGGPKDPLPIKLGSKVHHGLDDGYDNDILSLRRFDERAILKLREGVLNAFSSYMTSRRFTQIHSPGIDRSENGNQEQLGVMYRQSLLPIFGRVYEMGLGANTSLSCESGYITSARDLLEIVVGFMNHLMNHLNDDYSTELDLLSRKMPTVGQLPFMNFEAARQNVGQKYGYRFSNRSSMQAEERGLVSQFVRELIGSELVFLTDLPAESSPFYAMPQAGNSRYADGFVLLFRGHELATGGQRIHDYDMQVDALRAKGIDPYDFDEYLKLHRYGLPPHGGFTINLKYLMQFLFDSDRTPSIRHPQCEPQASDVARFEEDFHIEKFLFGRQSLDPSLLEAKNLQVERKENDQITALLNSATPLGTESGIPGSLAAILSHFAMKMEDVEFLLNLLPKQKSKVLQWEPEKILQFLWSILGHDHIREWLKDPSLRELVQKFSEMKILTDYKQMRFLHKDTLETFDYLNRYYDASLEGEDHGQKRTGAFIKFARRLLANNPNDFATIMHNLKIMANEGRELPIDNSDEKILLDSIPDGCTTPILFSIYQKLYQSPDRLRAFLTLIRNKFSYLHENREIDSAEVNEIFYKEMLAFCEELGPEFYKQEPDIYPEILYHLYKPINMDICALTKHLEDLKGRTKDMAELGLVFGGQHWEEDLGCYSFRISRESGETGVLQLYFSKNVPSFFAKASAGICTLNDAQLYERKDHFHLNLVDGDTHIAVGNVQAYVLEDKGKRILMLRAINPSDSYVTMNNGGDVFKSIIRAVVELAEQSAIDEICVSESMGVWHAQSSRAPIKAILALIYDSAEEVQLDSPFCIYNYLGTDKHIQKVYKLWSAK